MGNPKGTEFWGVKVILIFTILNTNFCDHVMNYDHVMMAKDILSMASCMSQSLPPFYSNRVLDLVF